MRVTITFEDELNPALEQHLEKGTRVQDYVRAAVHYFNSMIRVERAGNSCGYGNSARFRSYNSVLSPLAFLHSAENSEFPNLVDDKEIK